ncbi:hypothetical protein MXC99_12680 [Thauera aromatica]|uniref:hypothetical protein n=1 Tax=Thauera aromatica TaxID=59405 RepID=UPI001FFC65FD|nr:hypothetical protein [Thauera aromatica]MCK2089028.1 hypothetical protein [Thauera aromatica]
MMIIADFGARREQAFELEMARLFPGEPTKFDPGDHERAEKGDAAAMLRCFRIGLSAEKSDLEKMGESKLAGALLAAEMAAKSVNMIFGVGAGPILTRCSV